MSTRKQRPPYTEEELAEVASRYDSMKEFRANERRVYDVILKRGLLDKLCGHMKREKKYWTDEELADVALKYDKIKDLRKSEPSVYTLIKTRGLREKLFSHMKPCYTKPKTKEELAVIAAKYDVYAEFVEKEPKAYMCMANRGYVDELCAHMKKGHRKGFTYDELKGIALKYKSFKEFEKNDNSALHAIYDRGLIDELCGHLERGCHKPWSEEDLAEVASRYTELKEFRENELGVYQSMQRRGLIKKLCGHMKRIGNLYKRKIYVFTFSDGYAYVGLAQNPKQRFKQHITGKGGSPILNHIRTTGASYNFTILTDWLHKDEAAKMEDEYMEKYKSEGWTLLNRMKGGSLGNLSTIYTEKRIRKETAKYEYIEDFKEESFAFFRYLLMHGLIKKYCSHMKRKNRSHKKWTIETAIETAKKCKTRTEFSVKYYQAFDILKKAGLLDKYLPSKRKFSATSA